ncbi:hypothetical protein BGZ52_007798 [Haplosporangium bisporale]|nr:hypothetical protein BGZ52_007798 [Haplosporangium bisporale]
MARIPAPLSGHSLSKVQGATFLLAAGGESSSLDASHILLFEPSGAWSTPALSKNDTVGFHRLYHATLSTGKDGALLQGGYLTTPANGTVVSSLVTLKNTANFRPNSSTPVALAPHGPALARHTMTLTTDGQAVILGGVNSQGQVANLSIAYILDTQSDNDEWKVVPLNGVAPDPRMAFSTVLVNSTTMLVYGGTKDFQSAYSAPFYLDLPSWTWSSPATTGDAPSRWGHTAAMSGSSMVVAFGKSTGGASSNIALLDTNTNTWTTQFRPLGVTVPEAPDATKGKLGVGAVLGIAFVFTVALVGGAFYMMVRRRKRRTRNTLARENLGDETPRSALRKQASQSGGFLSLLGLGSIPTRDRSSKRYSEISSHSDPLKISLRMAQMGYSPLSLGYPDAVVQQGSGIVAVSSHIYPNQACVETEKEPDGQETMIVYHTLTQAQQEALKLIKTTVQGKTETIRIDVVGHSHVGKTMLIRLFISGEFEDRCHPSMSSGVYHKTFELDRRSISLHVVNVSGLTSISSLALKT